MPTRKTRRMNGCITSQRAAIKCFEGEKKERKRSNRRSFNFSSCDEQLLQLENRVMKPEPGSSCHTQANDKLKRTGVFSRANGEESFPSAVSGPKKTSAKIHRRNSASACVRAAAGARGGQGRDRRGPSPSPCPDGGGASQRLGTRTAKPFSFFVSKMP